MSEESDESKKIKNSEQEESKEQDDGNNKQKKNKNHRKNKPWDSKSIDHWKIDPVTPDDPLPPPIEESSFATLFPKYREKYLREAWPLITSSLKQFGISCELNLIEGSMTVKTTRKTWDPSVILKARDCIKLLARSIPANQALKILQDDMYCDIIKIKNLVRNKERFVKRRQRLIGPNGATLKAIELVTNCYVMIQGNTVSAMGSIKGLKSVRNVIVNCMKNIHPIYMIKQLMIKRELANDPKLSSESWDRFLPKFKKKNARKKKTRPIVQKEYNPFPPAQTPRKIDRELETGQYFLTKQQKDTNQRLLRNQQRQEAKQKKQQDRLQEFTVPQENTSSKKRKSSSISSLASLTALKEKLQQKESKSTQIDCSDYIEKAPKKQKQPKQLTDS